MRQGLNRTLTRVRAALLSFTVGQRVVAVIGTAALVLAAFMVFRWASTPNYAPLYSNLTSQDASAVVDELDAQGTRYQLANGGSTIMVPRDDVYSTRIALSGQGLPKQGGSEGYSLLDGQDISTSEFQEQTDFKRAMEGELASTVEALDGINTAVVHLALPPSKVFADEQDPPTASVLIDTSAGTTFGAEQVQAIVHLVASSIDGLDPDDVTVADATGKVLSAKDGAGSLGASTRDQQVANFQQKTSQRIQSMLDRVVGAGNSTVQVTADLDFDRSVTESTTYTGKPGTPPLSSSTSRENYTGPPGGTQDTGVVGPDGQMDSFGSADQGESSYVKKSGTADNAIDKVVEHRETAPGALNSMNVGVVIDSAAAMAIDANEVQDLIASTVGINKKRGDTVQVSVMPFDRTADEANAAALAAAAEAARSERMWTMIRNAGIVVAVVAILLLAWLRSRGRGTRREQTTAYLIEQLRTDAAERAAAASAVETSPALAALESSDETRADDLRRDLADFAENQPSDVAALLRGWLVDRPR